MQGKLLLSVLLCLLLGALWNPVWAGSGMETDYMWVGRYQEMLSKALEGNAEAQYELARMYEKGTGTKRDPTQARQWYEKSAEQGFAKSRAQLGYMFLHGKGVKMNRQRGITLLTQAAEAGNVRAQFYLAEAYEKGQGLSKNAGKALDWYKRSAQGGYRPARKAIDALEQKRAAAEERRMAREAATAKKAKQEAAARARKKKSVKTKKQTRIRLTQILYDNDWATDGSDALVLPSGVNECKQLEDVVFECLSKEVERQIGTATITYVTKALIHDMDRDGQFKITYQNNVLHVKHHKTNNVLMDSSDTPDIKRGWQIEHLMKCRLTKGNDQVDCEQKNAANARYRRRSSDDLFWSDS